MGKGNRLQFVHCDRFFATREEAMQYVNGDLIYINRPALYAEPMVLKYGEDESNPNILLAIGSVGDGVTQSTNNKVFFIDVKEIQDNVQDLTKKVDNWFDTFVESGRYDNVTESIVLTLSNGEEVYIEVTDLIEEWGVEENGTTPIILTKKHVVYEEGETSHDDVQYRDVLKADIRISENPKNILVRETINGIESLYVDGSASNITCWIDDVKTNVQDALKSNQFKISESNGNIITKRNDGIFASVEVAYDAATHTLIFNDGVSGEKTYKLNSASILRNATYEKGNLVLDFDFTDGTSNQVLVPISEIVKDFELDNTNHTVNLVRVAESESGQWRLSADVNVSTLEDNILEVTANELYVKGTADNIQYTENSTVEGALTTLINDVTNIYEVTDTLHEDVLSAHDRIDGLTSLVEGNAESIETQFTEVHEEIAEEIELVKDEIAVAFAESKTYTDTQIKENTYVAELTYDPLTSKLTFNNGIATYEYNLAANSLVSDAKYDEDGNLVLVITKEDGTTEEVKVTLDKIEGGNDGESPITINVGETINGIKQITATLSVSNNTNNLIVAKDGSLFASKVASDHIGTYRDTEMTMQEALGRIAEEIDAAALTGGSGSNNGDNGNTNVDTSALQAQITTLQNQVSTLESRIQTLEEVITRIDNMTWVDFGTYDIPTDGDDSEGEETPEE